MQPAISTPLFIQHYPRGSAAFNELVNQNVFLAMMEDIGNGDLTAMLIPETQTVTAQIITREDTIVCGQDWVNACFNYVDQKIQVKWLVNEGEKAKANQLLCEITGNARSILTAERCALNFLQLLSAVASNTRLFVLAVSGTKAEILDTRKTIPGLRLAQKYAVTVGGGSNQRLALYDGILIKENHIAAAGGIAAALQHAYNNSPSLPIQIEVENLAQMREAIEAGAKNILLDNFSISDMREAVTTNQIQYKGAAKIEASGGVHLSSVRAIALTGVDRISVGSITKSIRAVDLSLRIKQS
jgi:nicotinate-nucleotide pyrophosphorylase (carboxylating)